MAKYVGQRVKRTEDPRLIQGLGHYVDDIKLPDTLHVAFLRSMYAHARITSIDVSEASHAPAPGRGAARPCAPSAADRRTRLQRVSLGRVPGRVDARCCRGLHR